MDVEKQKFKALLTEKIKEAVVNGRLPKYRYNVRVSRVSWNLTSAMVTTWIAGLGSINSELESIFEKCKPSYSGNIVFDGVREPDQGVTKEEMKQKSIDQIMEEHNALIRQKQNDFLKLNPGWDC